MNDNQKTVFGIVNGDRPVEFEMGVEIPPGKIAARAELERLGVGASVSMVQACHNANLPLEKGWRADVKAPRGPAKWKKKKYVAANDNDTGWLPIIEALRRDGRESDVPLIMRYRTLVEVVGTTAYDDEIDMGDESINIEQRSLKLSGDNFDKPFAKAIEKNWPGAELPGGEVSYREQRHTAKQIVSVGQRMNIADDETGTRTQTPLRLARSEDERIARIDGQPVLAALRAGMGGLASFFEDAVLGQWDLTRIGESLGYKHKARSREAKVLVYTAIDRLREQWRMIERQMDAAATACDRRVEARRAELEAERAAYLGLAA